MKVEDLILRSITRYPTLYHSRDSVLDHLFITIGNGYEWQDGELVDIFQDEYDDSRDPIGHSDEFLDDIERLARMVERYPDGPTQNAVLEFLKEQAKTRYTAEHPTTVASKEYSTSPYYSWYPASHPYARLYHIPDDIKPDWAAAALEVCEKIVAMEPEPYIKRWSSVGGKDVPEYGKRGLTELYAIVSHALDRLIQLGFVSAEDLERMFVNSKVALKDLNDAKVSLDGSK